MASKAEVERAWHEYEARQEARKPCEYQRRQMRQVLNRIKRERVAS